MEVVVTTGAISRAKL